jgi:rfaE bifunctional protein nucleotidyltransferase chain/domain
MRPIVPQTQRAEVLGALKPVDGVVIFNETTANKIIERLKPDIYVKGGDYSVKTLPEASKVKEYGGKISLIQIEVPTSTTAIINSILYHD